VQDLINRILLLLAFEGRFRYQQDVQDNSTTPEVAFIGEEALNYLRSNVAHSTYKIRASHFGTVQLICSAKIKQFDLYLITGGFLLNFIDEDDVFEFDIPVDDMQGMQIVQAAEELLQDDLDNIFIEMLSLFDELDN
jgi:hypothetical protein